MLSSIFLILGLVLIAIGVGHIVVPQLRNRNLGTGSKTKWVRAIVISAVGVLVMFLDGAVFYAQAGYGYLVQYPTGTQTTVLDPGYHAKWWGDLIAFKKVITIKFAGQKNETRGDDTTGFEPVIPIRFNDSVMANVSLATRFRLPEDPELFKKMALDYRTQNNLVSATLISFTREVTRNSARLLSAQEYIVGKGGEFEMAVLDQMENGIYILETKEYRNKTEENISNPDDRGLERQETIRYEVVKRVDEKGALIRKSNPLQDYGILVVQSTIEVVDPETKFKEMLAKQRDSAAQANVERQEAKKAEYSKQKIIAQGETEKATIRIDQEKLQIKKLIAIETQKKEEKIRVEQKELLFKSAQLEGKAKMVLADADAYARQKLMQADNALEVKLKALVEINKNYAAALKDKQLVPTIVISKGGDGTTTTGLDLIDLLTAKTAKELSVDLNTSVKTKEK